MPPKLERISSVEARKRFSRLVNRVSYGKERVLLTWRGIAMVAVIPITDLVRLERAEEPVEPPYRCPQDCRAPLCCRANSDRSV
jgi:prevent-host-death family protein